MVWETFVVACCAKSFTNTPHNKTRILIADILELEGLSVGLTGRKWKQLTAALRITLSLTLSVRPAIIMIIFMCQTTINTP